MRARHRRREKEKPRWREEARDKNRGSMKPPNLTLRGNDIKLDHNVTTNRGSKQLVGKQKGSSMCLRLQSCIVWTLKAY